MNATYKKHDLKFIKPGGTSRGVLHTKETFILTVTDGRATGVGECAVFRGLSADDVPDYEEKLKWLCENISLPEKQIHTELQRFPSLLFGYEQAMLNLKYGEDLYYPGKFTEGSDSVKINGLIWMGTADEMKEQIAEKLKLGFSCIKLKIGVNWPEEHDILVQLRQQFSATELELRVDANGGFSATEAPSVLRQLADLEVHSIEQPIKAGQVTEMAILCAQTPVPIALDEELIGKFTFNEKNKLLNAIAPQYIILKPSLVGGFSGTDEWIALAEENGCGWWITSALESNIGLNALAQYTYTKQNPMPQGLGTGSLFSNNFESRLQLRGDRLYHPPFS